MKLISTFVCRRWHFVGQPNFTNGPLKAKPQQLLHSGWGEIGDWGEVATCTCQSNECNFTFLMLISSHLDMHRICGLMRPCHWNGLHWMDDKSNQEHDEFEWIKERESEWLEFLSCFGHSLRWLSLSLCPTRRRLINWLLLHFCVSDVLGNGMQSYLSGWPTNLQCVHVVQSRNNFPRSREEINCSIMINGIRWSVVKISAESSYCCTLSVSAVSLRAWQPAPELLQITNAGTHSLHLCIILWTRWCWCLSSSRSNIKFHLRPFGESS